MSSAQICSPRSGGCRSLSRRNLPLFCLAARDSRKLALAQSYGAEQNEVRAILSMCHLLLLGQPGSHKALYA